ncbi:MAG: isomerase [Ignavibacteria bacterium GWF2_33_9]|nr:MAG: isomerase [Ignavibacteria bacterium GWF2_33_9]
MNSFLTYKINAFADSPLKGNPAAVCIIDKWLETEKLQKIAAENFLPETAFIIKQSDYYELRWFTPEIEMDLCGHATMASAFVVFNYIEPNLKEVLFKTQSGDIIVTINNELLTLNFPSRMPIKAGIPEIILQGIGIKPKEVYKSRDYILVYENEEIIRQIKPNKLIIDQINLDPGGIIITAIGNEVDFVSRFFTPQASIFEDPVTGSAHCSLIPFWSQRLNKTKMIAKQISERGGVLYCEDKGTRVLISGKCCASV